MQLYKMKNNLNARPIVSEKKILINIFIISGISFTIDELIPHFYELILLLHPTLGSYEGFILYWSLFISITLLIDLLIFTIYWNKPKRSTVKLVLVLLIKYIFLSQFFYLNISLLISLDIITSYVILSRWFGIKLFDVNIKKKLITVYIIIPAIWIIMYPITSDNGNRVFPHILVHEAESIFLLLSSLYFIYVGIDLLYAIKKIDENFQKKPPIHSI
jgi:hypothetical protein